MNVTGHILATNFFSGLFENRSSKILFMVISIVLILAGLALSYSIIWYERYGLDVQRTIVNQLFSQMCWTGIEFICLITVPEWFRFLYGPFPHLPCWLHVIIKNAVVAKLLFLQTGLIVIRYAWIFWLKNEINLMDFLI